MNGLCFTTRDYAAYLQMTRRRHLLAEDIIEKQSLANQFHDETIDALDIDDVSYLVCFDQPLTNREKIYWLYSDAIRFSHAEQLVRVVTRYIENSNISFVELRAINDPEAITQRADQILTQAALSKTIIPKLTDVRDYLLGHLDLMELLPFILRVTSEAVSETAELSLETYRDPEIHDVYLALFVRSVNHDAEFFQGISNARARYTDSLIGKSGWLIVTTDFNPPTSTS